MSVHVTAYSEDGDVSEHSKLGQSAPHPKTGLLSAADCLAKPHPETGLVSAAPLLGMTLKAGSTMAQLQSAASLYTPCASVLPSLAKLQGV